MKPRTDRQLEDKFLALAAPVLGQDRAPQVASMCWGMQELDNVSALLALTVPQG